MTYHPHGIHVSLPQVRKLARGERVRLTHAKLSGPHKVYLSEPQLKKLHKAHSAGKGAEIHMSHDQIHHHRVHGGSIFDTLKSFGKVIAPKLIEIGTPIVKDLAQKGLEKGINLLSDKVRGKLAGTGVRRGRKKKGSGFFDDFIAEFPKAVVRGATGALLGHGVKKGRKMSHEQGQAFAQRMREAKARKRGMVKGEGFWDDLGSIGKQVLTDVAIPAIGARLTRGRGRARKAVKTSGDGLWA